MISLNDMVENTVGKRRKCMLEIFSPFPTMFSKTFLFRAVKSLDCVVKSKHQLSYMYKSTNAFNCLQQNPDFTLSQTKT